MMLANHAESPPGVGVIYITGGGWDTVTVTGPSSQPGSVATLMGSLAVRLLFHITETEQEHQFTITVLDEDGAEVAKITGAVVPPRPEGLPPTWPIGINLVMPVTGLPVPHYGNYTVSVQVDGQHLGDTRFRVLKGF